ncbi:MAG: tetratricopeptide repeat protein [Rhodospirillales bacterium]|nr:tetratricopeptide repeat protein [Rhodospirillales bacterium]
MASKIAKITRKLGFAFAAILGAGLFAPIALASGDTADASPLGSYLAGRHAQYAQDPKAAIEFYQNALKRFPGNRDIQRRIITLLVAEGRINDALPLARQLPDQKAGNGNNLSLILVALGNIQSGNLASADKILAGMPKSGLDLFILPLMRAWTLVGLKRYDDALAQLDTGEQNRAFTILFGAHTALIIELAGSAVKAERHYKDAIGQRRQPNLRLTQLYGNYLERAGRQDDAKSLYDTYQKAHPASTLLAADYKRLKSGAKPSPMIAGASDGAAEALFSLSGSVQEQNAGQAILFAQMAVYLKPDFTIARLLIAETLESSERHAAAIDEYRKVAKDPAYAWTARLRIADNFDSQDNVDEAVHELRSMARENTERYDALIRMGDILRRRKRYREATRAYADAKSRIPVLQSQHWALLYTNGIANERIKNWPQAEADFLKALELSPDQPFVLNYLGYSWVEQGKNLDRARKMIETAVKMRPRDGYIVDSLGWVLFRLGDIKGAVKHLERAVVLRPEDPTVNDHLGDVYWKVGRRNEARFQWERALILEPEQEFIPKIKEKLRKGL